MKNDRFSITGLGELPAFVRDVITHALRYPGLRCRQRYSLWLAPARPRSDFTAQLRNKMGALRATPLPLD